MVDTIKVFTNSRERFCGNTLEIFYVSFLQSAIYQFYIYIYLPCTPQRHAGYLLKYRSCSVTQTSNCISGIAKTSLANNFSTLIHVVTLWELSGLCSLFTEIWLASSLRLFQMRMKQILTRGVSSRVCFHSHQPLERQNQSDFSSSNSPDSNIVN